MSIPVHAPPANPHEGARLFEFNWNENAKRSAVGVSLVKPDFVVQQGRRVRLLDVRAGDELVGPLGHIPGCDWVPLARLGELQNKLDLLDPIVVISRGSERAVQATRALEGYGFARVAAMLGGIIAWRDLGYATIRDRGVLTREGQLRDLAPNSQLATGAHLTQADVELHVGDPLAVRWIKLAALLVHSHVSCVDGRDDSGLIGTPGGDAGEFLLGLAALEQLTGKPLSEGLIKTLLARRIDTFGDFYLHTDAHAADLANLAVGRDAQGALATAQLRTRGQWRKFWAEPPDELHPLLLQIASDPAHIGCGHLRHALLNPREYGVRTELAQSLIRTFFRTRWTDSADCEYVPLDGAHSEAAVLNIRLEDDVKAFSMIPLVTPAVGQVQAFVNHPQVASYIRRQLAEYLVAQRDVFVRPPSALDLHVEMEHLARVQLQATLGRIALGLPVFDVVLSRGGVVEVEPRGFVTA
jgi:rhodanese-related sulfurtransferase